MWKLPKMWKLPMMIICSVVVFANAANILAAVPSSSPADIPPTATYCSPRDTTFCRPLKANLLLAYVHVSSTEHKVWFGVDNDGDFPFVFYNRRYRATTTSPWYWEFDNNLLVIDYRNYYGSSFAASVLTTETASPASSKRLSQMMALLGRSRSMLPTRTAVHRS